MRRRERAFVLVLGTICAFGLLGGAWPLPLIAFALLELSFTAVEHAVARAAQRRATPHATARPAATGRDAAGGILRATP